MDNDFLYCLIDEAPQPSYIPAHYNSNGYPVNVDALKQIIFNRKCRNLASDYHSISLLDVRVLLVVRLLISLRSMWSLTALGTICLD